MRWLEERQGVLSAVPLLGILLLGFVAPFVVVGLYSTMPQRVFSLGQMPTFEAYGVFFMQGFVWSLMWSLAMALMSTAALFLLCYPLAFAMVRVFHRFAIVITVGVVVTLFVSENIRLFGWVLTLMKGGVIDGHLSSFIGVSPGSALYNVPIIVFGLIYAYFPFMLFPLVQGVAMVPEDVRAAASDLGASWWRVLWEIDLPLAMPGIIVGSLLSFSLAAGALAESKLLGGQVVIVFADEIETAFTYGQNWPLGSALSVVIIVIVAVVAISAVTWIDLDRIIGRRQGS